ncbi:unnamed protein product, partial [Heterotrigona itama]
IYNTIEDLNRESRRCCENPKGKFNRAGGCRKASSNFKSMPQHRPVSVDGRSRTSDEEEEEEEEEPEIFFYSRRNDRANL